MKKGDRVKLISLHYGEADYGDIGTVLTEPNFDNMVDVKFDLHYEVHTMYVRRLEIITKLQMVFDFGEVL